MSKSLGNVVDPVETIQEYGSDALRFTLATGKLEYVCTLETTLCDTDMVELPLRCKALCQLSFVLSWAAGHWFATCFGAALVWAGLLLLCMGPDVLLFCASHGGLEPLIPAASQAKVHDLSHPCAGTTPGQDINLSMDKVVSNRNLTNKLWNAGKFILFNLKDATEQEWDELGRADFTSQKRLESLPLAERWIVSLLHEVGSIRSRGLLYDWRRLQPGTQTLPDWAAGELVSQEWCLQASSFRGEAFEGQAVWVPGRFWGQIPAHHITIPLSPWQRPVIEVCCCLCHLQVVTRSTAAHDRQDFGDAGREFYDFFWGEFADWYIEAAKARLYSSNVQAAAQTRQVGTQGQTPI